MAKFGHKVSEATREKLRIAFTGRKASEETKRKMSETNKRLGKVPPSSKGTKWSEERRKLMSERNKGQVMTEEQRKKLSLAKKGKPLSEKQLNSVRESAKKRRGKNAYQWKGGIVNVVIQIRNSYKYKEWRQAIYVRDDFTCQKCNVRGGKLEAHHLKGFAPLLDEAREALPLLDIYDAAMVYTPMWDIGNGITLCKSCHHKEGNHGRPQHKGYGIR